MEGIIEVLSQPWAVRALLVSTMIGLMYGVLGSFVVLRNLSLIGDALSHSILPGVFFAFIFVGYSSIGFFVGSVIAGLLTAVLITLIQQHIKTKSDAAIGIVFTVMFSIGVIGISWLNNEQGVHLDLKDFLVGSIMGIADEEIWLTFVVMVYTIVCVVVFYRYLLVTTFQEVIAQTMGISVKMVHYFLMMMLSFAIVSGLKTVGVILVVALLIIPSSTALLLSNNLQKVVIISAIIGMLSTISGLIVAIILDFPPGPAMVLVGAVFYILAALFAKEKGLVNRRLRSLNQMAKIEKEDILRLAIKASPGAPMTIDRLREGLGLKANKLQNRLKSLEKEGLVSIGDTIDLTAKGRVEADALVRAHRLWESYQVTSMGLTEEQIHAEADRLEHHLTEEILDEVDMKLGYPITDPHGSPIPKKIRNRSELLLAQVPNAKIKIIRDQEDTNVESELWDLGILPDTYVTMAKITENQVFVKSGNRTIPLDADLAGRILVSK